MADSRYTDRGSDERGPAGTGRFSRPLAFVAGGVMTVLLGMGLGDVTSDPTGTKAYQALESELSDTHVQHIALTGDAELLSQEHDELMARVAELEEELAALEDGEPAVTEVADDH